MEKYTVYERTRFSVPVLKEAVDRLRHVAESEYKCPKRQIFQMSVQVGDDIWDHDSESEFFADCRNSMHRVSFVDLWKSDDNVVTRLSFKASGGDCHIYIAAEKRDHIQQISEVFSSHAIDSRLPPHNPVVFLGHGRSTTWRELKDHLQDKHDMVVEAYEVGARAGHAIRDILGQMLDVSSIAFLVMTGEDQTDAGTTRPRQNVVHEAGLFQGKLGFNRAIMLVEEGVETFTNVEGIQQIRSPKGHIESTFGEVLATLRREFPPNRRAP